MTVAIAPAPTVTLSAQQHKGRLWADDGLRVHAVVMGSAVPELPERLAAALAGRQIDDYDCLVPGALPGAAQRQAPYVALLRRESAFTDWLLFEAAAALGDWGVLALSAARLSALRSHLRSLLAAQAPDGRTLPLAWMDPLILQALLPLFDAAALPAFMGPVDALVIPGAQAWTWARLQQGRLALTAVAIAKAA